MQQTQETTTLHDFNDGNGPIPAHRHINGDGWVADTAHVEDTVYIGRNARVFGYATVKDEVVIIEDAEVSGYAVIRDLVCIKGKSVIRGACTIKESAEIAGNVFIASHIVIGGHTLLNKEQRFFKVKDCLQCPALLNANYGSTQDNPCLYCLEKLNGHKNVAPDSRRATVRSWLPKDGGINQNVETETDAPQKRGTHNP